MQKTGVLPNNLGTLAITMDVKKLAKRVVDAVEQMDLSDDQAQKLLEAITGEPMIVEADVIEEEVE